MEISQMQKSQLLSAVSLFPVMITPMMEPVPEENESKKQPNQRLYRALGSPALKAKDSVAAFDIDEIVAMENAKQLAREDNVPGEEPLTDRRPCTLGDTPDTF
jgi:hypothetical protein